MKHRQNMLSSIVSVLLILGLVTMPAHAYDFDGVVVRVTSISSAGFPENVKFTSDNTPSACNGYLFYFPHGSDAATQQMNAEAVLLIVQTAQLSGRSLTIYGINPTGSFQYCTVQRIVLNN